MPNLAITPLHLGLGATAVVQPDFTGMDWYEGYGTRHAADGTEGRLVSQYDFHESWTSWEVHPAGAEVVICVAGRIALLQEQADGHVERIALDAGDYAINPPGVWHTADIAPGESVTCIFITAGEGTDHRPR